MSETDNVWRANTPSVLENERLTEQGSQLAWTRPEPPVTLLTVADDQGAQPTLKFDHGTHVVNTGRVEASGDSLIIASGDAVVAARGGAIVQATDNVAVDATQDAKVVARGHARVLAGGDATIEAHDQAQVKLEAQGSPSAFAFDQSAIDAQGGEVRAYDQARVAAHGDSKVFLCHQEGAQPAQQITLSDNAKVVDVLMFDQGEHWVKSGDAEARGSAILHASGHSHTDAFGTGTIIATEAAVTTGHDRSNIVGYDQTVLFGFGRSHVEAHGSAEVHGHDDPTIESFDQTDVATNDGTRLIAHGHTKVSVRDSMWMLNGNVDAYDDVTVKADRFPGMPWMPDPVTLHDRAVLLDVDPKTGKNVVKHAGDK